ncbi:MAG: hypothetical protein EBQ89_00415 [Alphaproteobacteria bacterium]|nr:hypothetical protein [Alphaproteobacteria bacterium]NDC95436.1 hypothetical protein [bacterium]
MKTATAHKPRKTKPVPCIRCGGGGYVNSTVDGGVCYRCHGARRDPTVYDWTYPAGWTAEQIAAFLAEQDRKAAARQAKRDEKRKAGEAIAWAANVEACPALAGLAEIDPHGDLVTKARRYPMTEKQRAYAAVLLDRHRAAAAREQEAEARRAAGVTVPTGKQTVRGVVAGFKDQESRYGTVRKMIVRTAEGWAVYVSVPAGIDPARGDTVEFSATLERSDRDPLFGFGSRPTRARIVETNATE